MNSESFANRHIVIIGATSGIAEHCARRWAQEGAGSMTLVARNTDRLSEIRDDLTVRRPGLMVHCLSGEFLLAQGVQQLVDNVLAIGNPDIVLIAHGSLPDQSLCQQSLTLCAEQMNINALSPVLFAEAFVSHMEKVGHGTLAVLGSVAGDRGRKSNYVYGAAKGLVTRYLQGLQHRLAGSNVRVVLVKPGPTDTAMTAHLKQQGSKLASVEEVAAAITTGIASGKPVIYAPAKWALIMMIIRHLPRFIFNRMDI
ncbi:MAG: SDR family NAD(P)-dependent oxidoreductase [Pseudohongiella sp.]|nr:SDR family NAD(P)-dependent oxidoreductase [Pseudohongiella sp.]MDO9521748.1 SDR family NAD(P)-dependent oxidoreductase [Pseudohongiella sp.]